MTPIRDAARAANNAGLVPIPIRGDATKAPALQTWAEYQTRRPSNAELKRWFADDTPGLGIICGAVSGNLELLEFEACADMDAFSDLITSVGLGALWDRITTGYMAMSPSGGWHLPYRVEGATIPGNTKLARYQDAAGIHVVAETRGEGGYFVAAPSLGACHPSGQPWTQILGGFATIATITPKERAELHQVVRLLDAMPTQQPPTEVLRDTIYARNDDDRPGDRLNAAGPTGFAALLIRHGWDRITQRPGIDYYRRPGKTVGISATVAEPGHAGRTGRHATLKVFSSSTPFDTERTYDLLGALAVLEHGGDITAAAKSLITEREPFHFDRNGKDPNWEWGGESRKEPETEGDGVEPYPLEPIGQWCADVDNRPPPRFLVRGLIVADDYGVLGATKKLGKSLFAGDLAISVSAGVDFLGKFPVDTTGTVALFAGEGGRRKLVRRLRAIADNKKVLLDDLSIYVYERAPKLANLTAALRLTETLRQLRPVLCIIDPAYLALSGAKTADLASMGELLERAQLAAQDAGSALLLTHHWNKTGLGTGADRFTGAGFAEWGRFLISGEVISKRIIDKTTEQEIAIIRLEITGDETPDKTITYRRTMWVDNPADLASPMHYELEVLEDDDLQIVGDALADFKPSVRRILAALGDGWAGWRQIGDTCAIDGHPLKKTTILDGLSELVRAGLVEVDATGISKCWRVSADTSPPKEPENAF